jgi:AcrR family transcriptional regulator
VTKTKSNSSENGRSNQRHRTRKDLLAAATRLLKSGKTPDMDAVAAEAMVSRATAYRYFPSVEALLIEAPLDGAVPSPDDVFADDRSTDAFERVAKAEAALYDAVKSNEAQLRLMLAASLERKAKGLATDGIPIRQNRRQGLIEAALAPVRDQMTTATYEKLCASLALIFGTEAMIVFSDVLGMDEKTANRVKGWAMRALIDEALEPTKKR